MVEYTIDDIRGPTVAREMAQLKEFVLAKFNGAIADAEAAAAAAATAAAQAVLDSLDARVGALEGDMTTAQGAIVTLDGSVVKLAGAQTITGVKNVPLEATGTDSNQIASSQKVKNELDNYAPMMRTTGNQTIGGIKQFTKPIDGTSGGWHACYVTSVSINEYVAFAELKGSATGNFIEVEFMQSSNTAILYGHAGISNTTNANGIWFVRKATATNNPLQAGCLVIAKDADGKQYLAIKRSVQYGALNARVVKSYTYGNVNDTPSPQIDWLSSGMSLGDGTGYTLTTVIE